LGAENGHRAIRERVDFLAVHLPTGFGAVGRVHDASTRMLRLRKLLALRVPGDNRGKAHPRRRRDDRGMERPAA